MDPISHTRDFLSGCHRITEQLWQTSGLGELRLPWHEGRWATISLVETPEPVSGGQVLLRWPIADGPLPDLTIADVLASFGADWIRSGNRLCVHCLEGNNRSGLMAGLVLRRLGMSGREAAEKVRAANPDALYNEAFRIYLEGLT